MKKFDTLESVPAYLPIVNIDTDMIIPKQFLKTIKRTGLGKNLFFEMRYDETGKEIGSLHKVKYKSAPFHIDGKFYIPSQLREINDDEEDCIFARLSAQSCSASLTNNKSDSFSGI